MGHMKWLAKIFGRAEGTVAFPDDTQLDTTVCSFCRHSWSEVGPLVASPAGVFICDACIEHCRAVLDEEKRRRGTLRTGAEPPPPHSTTEVAEGHHAGDRGRVDRPS